MTRKFCSTTLPLISMLLLLIFATFQSKWNGNSYSLVKYGERSTKTENLRVGKSETGINYGEDETERVEDVRKRRLPNAIIAGFAKCGTRALIWFLSNNDVIKAAQQELHFFDRYYEKGLDWYRDQFPPRLESEIGIEKPPAYISDDPSTERIYRMNSSLRIIVIICEPVQKAISQYSQLLSHKTYNDSFEKVVLNQKTGEIDPNKWIVRDGMYVYHLKRTMVCNGFLSNNCYL